MLQVTEIFYSIQGESSFVGRPCVFVRLTGCPLRCHWCDTEYSFFGGTGMPLEEIVDRVASFGCSLVEVTGGEPLHQPEALSLIKNLQKEKFTVLVETSGAVDIAAVDPEAHVIMDIKCPGSGMADRMIWKNVDLLKGKDEAKFVLHDREDYEWAKSIVAEYDLTQRCSVLFGPVFGKLDLRQLSEWILADKLPVRLQVQLHKYIWDPDTRGV